MIVDTPSEEAKNGTKLARGANFRCLLSTSPIEPNYIKAEGKAGRMSTRLMAIVAEGVRGRVYLEPTAEHEAMANATQPPWIPETLLPDDPRNFWTIPYGLAKYGDLFTSRQLTALNAFCDCVSETRERARLDGIDAGMVDDGVGIDQNGAGATAYAEAVSMYLAFGIDRSADYWSSLCTWHSGKKMEALRNTFGRQALPMSWDFAEGNPFSESSGNWLNNIEWTAKAIDAAPAGAPVSGWAIAAEATEQRLSAGKVISTDPPYYDNIAYADLSDFFYVWLRKSLKTTFPTLFATLAVPKAEELVATPYRHGGKANAEGFFLDGMTRAMHNLARQAHAAFPVTIYYAFKQAETKGGLGTSSSGWEAFLEAVVQAGFAIAGTWPMRTEMSNRMIGSGTNALASSVVLVCRRRGTDAQAVSRRQFLRELNAVLPEALDAMTRGAGDDHSPVAPVDLSQAIIGPGMAVYSKYSAVLEADGSAMSVKTALQIINRFLAEDDFDHDTQFCLHWFEQNGWAEGPFGEADVLARAKATSVAGITESGVVKSRGGKVRLLRPNEYPVDWNPRKDSRVPIWEALHQLIRALRAQGESGAGQLLAAVKPKSEAIRQLAYRLYTLCERRGWADDARTYNELVTSWTAVEAAAGEFPQIDQQLELNLGGNP